MNKFLQKNKKGFTLTEILIVTVILLLVAALIIPKIWGMMFKAGKAEGLANLGAIRSAQLLLHDQIGRFKLAQNLSEIESMLSLAIGSKFYDYQVVEASEEDFLALAIPNWPYDQWLEQMAITKDGFVASPSTSGGGGKRPSGSGGTSGGTSGGSEGGGDSGGSSGGGVPGGGSIFTTPDTTDPSLDLDTDPIITPVVPVPAGLELISNDGWITMGWNDVGDPFSYRVYQSDSIDGDFVLANAFFDTGTFASPSWADNVTNGVTTCYRITAVGTTTTGDILESNPSTAVCGQAVDNDPLIIGDSPYAEKADDALTELGNVNINISGVDGVPTSDTLSNTLIVDAIPILFGPKLLEGNTLAAFNPVLNVIEIDDSFFGSPDELIATLLAHETLHYIWDQDYEDYVNGVNAVPLLGTPPNPPGGIRSVNSIDQEYNSFLTQSQIWYNARGLLTDPEQDGIVDLFLDNSGIPVPEDQPKAVLEQVYTTLPDY